MPMKSWRRLHGMSSFGGFKNTGRRFPEISLLWKLFASAFYVVSGCLSGPHASFLIFFCFCVFLFLFFLYFFFSRDLDEITKNLQRLRQRCWRLHHKTRYSGMYNNGAGGRVLIKHSDLVNVVCFVFLGVLLLHGNFIWDFENIFITSLYDSVKVTLVRG